MNVPCLYTKYWPQDDSLEPKHVANCVLMTIYVLCLAEQITLPYCITQWDGFYQNTLMKFAKAIETC